VDEGDDIQEGQTLAGLDTARLQASRLQQEALLKEAEATLTLTESTFQRIAKLAVTGAVSSQDLDDATQRRDAAQASVDHVKAAMQSIDVDLAKSRLLAPYSGRIARRHVDEGTIVGAGQMALELIESNSLEARIGVTVSFSSDVNPGAEVVLRSADSEKAIATRVRQVSPQQDRRTRTVDVLLTILETGDLVPGDLVQWPMANSVSADGAWLPRTALTSSTRGLWAVYIAVPIADSPQHQLERREVEVIHLDGDRAFVRGALREGHRIVTDGLQRLVPGQHVVLSR
jgi:RND family efflux transporter MFP subunit